MFSIVFRTGSIYLYEIAVTFFPYFWKKVEKNRKKIEKKFFRLFFVRNNLYTCHMDFEIKNLTLYNDLVFTKDESNQVMKTEELAIFTNDVAQNEMSPERNRYLTNPRWCGYGLVPDASLEAGCKPDGVIPAGKYLFVQFFLDTQDEAKNQMIREAAAEALFLEASWQEVLLKDIVYVRTLAEGSKTVCQLFREIDIR